MKKTIKYSLVGFILALGFLSCKKLEFDKIAEGEWNPNIAIPLAYGEFDVYDVFAHADPEDLVVIDPNSGLIALVYKSHIASLSGKDIVQIPDVNASRSISLPDLNGVAGGSFSGTLTYSGSELVDFTPTNSARVKELKIDGGMLDLAISSSFSHPVKVTIVIPALKNNGDIFTRTISVSPNSGENHQIDLSNYIADLTVNNTTYNSLKVEYNVEVVGNGSGLNGSNNIAVNFNFSSITIDYAKGGFDKQLINIHQDSVLLKLYEALDEGYFELVDPRIHFFINNSFGLPLSVRLNQIRSINIYGGNEIDLLGYAQTHNLNYPTVIGDSALTTISFDKANTNNIQQVVTPAPKRVTFDADAILNNDNSNSTDFFISKNSKININSEVELPLHGLAHSFRVRDTIEFSTPDEAENFKSIMFRLVTDNGFPINVYSKIKFMDENHQEVFLIYNTQELLVKGAPVDANGRVTQRNKKITDISLTEDQILKLDKVEYIELSAEANTTDFNKGTLVKMYDDYKLGMKLSVQFVGKVKY